MRPCTILLSPSLTPASFPCSSPTPTSLLHLQSQLTALVACRRGAGNGGSSSTELRAAGRKDLRFLPALQDGQLKPCTAGGERVIKSQDGQNKSVTSTQTAVLDCFLGPLGREPPGYGFEGPGIDC